MIGAALGAIILAIPAGIFAVHAHYPDFRTFPELKFLALIINDLQFKKIVFGCPAFLDLFFALISYV